MPNINEVIVCTKWVSDTEGNRPDLDDFISMVSGEAWESLTGQSAIKIPTTPNLYIIRARLFNANYNTVKNSNRFFILARKTWNSSDPETILSNNLTSVPTAQQLITFKDTILARFPDADEDKLIEAGQAILEAGLTRAQIIKKLVKRWKRFQKAL